MDTTMPWNSVIKDSADSMEFWGLELQEPAMLFMTTRGDAAPSLAYQQREQEEKLQGKGKGKKLHPKTVKGKYTTNQYGTDICYKSNRYQCVDNCQRAHQCEKCLGLHKISDCPQMKGTGKAKGKWKHRKADQAAQPSH